MTYEAATEMLQFAVLILKILVEICLPSALFGYIMTKYVGHYDCLTGLIMECCD